MTAGLGKKYPQMWDVAIVGGGPAGATCASVCAAGGLRTLVIERAVFPREKVCGDCLNPAIWPVLERLGVAAEVRAAPHSKLEAVEFVGIGGRVTRVPLLAGDDAEISIRRSLFDEILLRRARSLGAEVREGATIEFVRREEQIWNLGTNNFTEQAGILIAADGRNSTVAQLCNLMPRKERDRVALQTHIPLPKNFGKKIVLQLLREGYSGQAPVDDNCLNLCLVSRPNELGAIKRWAEETFALSVNHNWRTIAPLARAALPPSQPRLLLVGDAARVVEPFTGEGIFYALRTGELAAQAIVRQNPQSYAQKHHALYSGRLWINRLARFAVEHSRLTSDLLRYLPNEKRLLRLLTSKVVQPR